MTLLIVIYCSCALLLMLYGINCHVLTRLYRRNGKTCQLNDQRVLRDFYGSVLPDDEALNLMGQSVSGGDNPVTRRGYSPYFPAPSNGL